MQAKKQRKFQTELAEVPPQLPDDRLAALGEITAMALNDMRNPLTGIQMGIDYLLNGLTENDPRWRGAALMRANVERIDRMIEDMLFVAEAPASILSPGRLWPLLQEELACQAGILTSKRARVELELPEFLPLVMFDPDQMRRVVAQVIGRAIAAMEPGGELHLSLRTDAGHQVLTLLYTPAMSPVEPAPEPIEERGRDLSMLVTCQIIKAHQGKLCILPGNGAGSGFIITLPNWPAAGQGSDNLKS